MEFFGTLMEIITCWDIKKKFNLFEKFMNDRDNWIFNHNEESTIFQKASYENFCTLVNPKIAPKRRGFNTDLKKATLIHAILHIEYSAIDLALDASYRYKNMPLEFYNDWLEVAQDEIRHFQLLEELLNEVGYEYGDLPVHNSLWEAGLKSLNLIDRMAVIPRWHEANGLDANEKIIQRLRSYNDDFANKIINALNIILEEEIPHVQKGDKWFKYECNRLGEDYSIYFDIIERVFEKVKKKDYMNITARKEAGFSCNEIQKLSNKNIEC